MEHPDRRGALPRRARQGEFLRAFRADIFFDDQRTHVDSALKHVAAGHVPHGVANEEKLPST
jgi:5'-nucleotidase